MRDRLIRSEGRVPVPVLRRWRSDLGVSVLAVESRDALLAGENFYQSWCELDSCAGVPLSEDRLLAMSLPPDLALADLLSREEVESRVALVKSKVRRVECLRR